MLSSFSTSANGASDVYRSSSQDVSCSLRGTDVVTLSYSHTIAYGCIRGGGVQEVQEYMLSHRYIHTSGIRKRFIKIEASS